ncbi:MAG: cytochrome c biosis protein [Herbinix sp.]|jgi:cytochrome c biogenesis protein CcdA/arsenate reductase-like glutaredoxin family protein|nr:cytochrome c biosis protein [Herbinix sp.]
MKLSIDKRILFFLLPILFFPFLAGFSNSDSQKFLITYQHTEKTLECILNEDGVLLLPLYDVLDLINYQYIECGRCGKDEIYNEDAIDGKGYLYINWYKNVITYSNDPTIEVLDAENEKIDGITFTSSMLYTYMGYTVDIDTSQQTIVIQAANSSSTDSSLQTDITTAASKDNIDTIIYAYDPNCSSCKEITTLLDDLSIARNIKLYKINVSDNSNKEELINYELNSHVPDVIKGIYPLVFIGDQYLFNSEITEENIDSLLQGEAIDHLISYPDNADFQAENNSISNLDGQATTFIYFYSTTCASCKTAVDFINQLKAKYPGVNAIGYNLYVPENITLLREYGKEYGLKSDQLGEIPVIFISDQALIGDKAILEGLELYVNNYARSKPTIVLDPNTLIIKNDIVHGFAVFGAGLLNGFNPCSLSMFLFLLSLMMLDGKKILKIGLSFSSGKFVMFFLLGTIFYKLLSKVNLDLLNFITKYLMLIFIVAFATLNLFDYVMAKKEKYNRMVLQLPSGLKQFNHQVMRRIATYSGSKYLIVIMVLLGMLLAFGEFMCTGQIYLTSIIVLIQGNQIEWVAILYLIIYSFAFILPLLIITLFIYFGKKVFTLSEGLLEKLPLIKVISSVLFIILGIYIVIR